MPGLVGFTTKSINNHEPKSVLEKMRSYIAHHNFYKSEAPFCSSELHATRSHINIIQTEPQPHHNSDIYLWLDGEFYNQDELIRMTKCNHITDPEIFLQLYKANCDLNFLKDIDGVYSAVLYDKKENKVQLITDRYGLKLLYWGIINDGLVWSSELKGFLGHPNVAPVINHQAVKEFFDNGYLLENHTWFDGIELMPPASVLTFDITKSKVQIQQYWSWSDIKPLKEPINEQELVEELGWLFKESVRRRVNKNERIGLLLSGGLDSRAILAAIPEDYKPIHTFTFGQKGCNDIKIASKASKIKEATHHILELNPSNWLIPRINGVWKSDGSFNLLDMHGIEFYNDYTSYSDFILNGFWGEVAIGGYYVEPFQTQSEEHIARNRGRRFINQTLVLGEGWLIYRRPFTDKNLAELAFSIPKNLRQHYHIYTKMLLSTFPKYYKYIPFNSSSWVSHPNRLMKLLEFKNRAMNKLKRKAQRFGVHCKDLRSYTDYPLWIRQEPAKSFFAKLLLCSRAIYPEYIERNKIQDYLRAHVEEKANYHNELCLALTFELWLQQVFNGKYRYGQEKG